MSKRDQSTLSDAINRMYDINRHVVSITPEFLADGAMDIIGFSYIKAPLSKTSLAHNAAWYGCNQYLRQLARAYCRGRFDPVARAAAIIAGEDQQFELHLEALQDRYPLKPQAGRSSEYVQRDHLSEADRWFNIDRLAATSTSLHKHRNALEAETVQLFGPRRDQ